jgi:putative ABC transport system substrate-binding protein
MAWEGQMNICLRRREFIAGLGGAAAWPLAARGQQRERMRHIGFLIGLPSDDPEGHDRHAAFLQGLQQTGWIVGRNLRMGCRAGGGGNYRRYAEQLIALEPEVVVAGGTPSLAALQQATATRSVPLVLANVTDPVGAGYVESLPRPGGNITGFMNVEFGLSAKLLELLKQVAPQVTRVGVIRNPAPGGGVGPFAAIQTAAPSFRVELTPINAIGSGQIERGIVAVARGSNVGLIVIAQVAQMERELIIALAARHRLPAVYFFRRFVIEGGLISFGNDQAEPYRLAAGYVDRILKGEKPADLPVQAPTKFETVLNLKTAKALGLDIPPTVYVRADEIIE